jgi:hypothetical protein
MAHVKEASRRWMYRGKRRNQVAKLLNRVDATAAAAGIGPKRLARLEVRGRRTGRRLSLPVVIAEYEGQRYLVAMLGKEANWVRNVRAAGGQAVLKHGRRENVVSKRSIPAYVPRSCDATSRRLPARGLTSLSIGALHWSSSSRSPSNTPCSGFAPSRRG